VGGRYPTEMRYITNGVINNYKWRKVEIDKSTVGESGRAEDLTLTHSRLFGSFLVEFSFGKLSC